MTGVARMRSGSLFFTLYPILLESVLQLELTLKAFLMSDNQINTFKAGGSSVLIVL